MLENITASGASSCKEEYYIRLKHKDQLVWTNLEFDDYEVLQLKGLFT